MRAILWIIYIFWEMCKPLFGLAFCQSVLGVRKGRERWLLPVTGIVGAAMWLFPAFPTRFLAELFLFGIAVGILCRGGMAQNFYVSFFAFGIICAVHYFRSLFTFIYELPFNSYHLQIILDGLILWMMALLLGDAKKCGDAGKSGWIFASLEMIYLCFITVTSKAWSSPEMQFGNMDRSLIFLMAGMRIALCALFLYYMRTVAGRQEMEQLKVFQRKNELEQTHYKRLEEVYGSFRGLAHDMDRYLSLLPVLSEKDGTRNTADGLAEEIRNRISEVNRKIYCVRPALNAILNEKEKEANESGIRYDIFAEPGFDLERLDDFALIGIISNLIDNALEAAEKCQKEKTVSVRMFAVNDGKQKFIRITNSRRGGEQPEERSFITWKKNPKLHGYGLKNVRKLVEESHGIFRIQMEEEQCTVELIF